jgi:dihydroflavonol-4-reductase
MARILVTGANGHLGANLVRAALARGDEVRALVRRGSDVRGLRGTTAEVVRGNVLDEGSLVPAMVGCATVLHAAAVYKNWARDPDEIVRPAVAGTRRVLEAAKKAGVRRVVVTSSNATIGYPSDPDHPLDESSFMREPKSAYIRAKCESEALALALGPELGVEVVVVNPCGIIGRHDWRVTPTMRAIRDVVNGGPIVLAVALTDVRDVAAGHLLAADRGAPGRRYLLSGDNLTPSQQADAFARLLGRRPKTFAPPALLLRGLAFAQETAARLGGREPELTRDILDDVAGGCLVYDSTRARTELGWTARPGAEAIEDAVRWLLFIDAVKPAIARRLRASLPVVQTGFV